jgi:glutamate formiminotransferase
VLVGARPPLVAFNVDLETTDVEIARTIAAAVRETGGGFRGVRALGLALPRSGRVQVSMNVEDWRAAPLHEVVAAIRAQASARGVALAGSELVGLLPAGAALAAAASAFGLPELGFARVLELRLLETVDES